MRFMLTLAVILTLPFAAQAEGPSGDAVNITVQTPKVTVQTADGPVDIMRNQDQNAVIEPAFAKTSRNCPPFCVQPMIPAAGVNPAGELEVIGFLANKSAIVIDARTPDWHLKGTIPGSVNIPFTEVSSQLGELGCKNGGGSWDCLAAKDVCLYSNGPWCGQSTTAIEAMIREGFPADKIHYYRGGIQDWKILGLNTVGGSR